jgi:hypothetical protein
LDAEFVAQPWASTVTKQDACQFGQAGFYLMESIIFGVSTEIGICQRWQNFRQTAYRHAQK